MMADKRGEEDDNYCQQRERTPNTNPEDFDPWRKGKKRNKETGEIWEKDPSRHGGEHYEVYKNKNMAEKRIRHRAVWADGRVRRYY
jgi:hypothetical protein